MSLILACAYLAVCDIVCNYISTTGIGPINNGHECDRTWLVPPQNDNEKWGNDDNSSTWGYVVVRENPYG